MINLRCKIGTNDVKTVKVNPSDRIYNLLNKLDINDENAKFMFNGMTYSLASNLTFSEIGLKDNYSIFIMQQRISGISGKDKKDCGHYITNYYCIFPCCNKPYQCWNCHDNNESHKCSVANKYQCFCGYIYEGDLCGGCKCKKYSAYK